MKPQTNRWCICFHVGGSYSWWKRRIQNIIKLTKKHWSCHAELYNPYTEMSLSSRGFKRMNLNGHMQTGVFWADLQYSHPERWRIFRLPKLNFDQENYITEIADNYRNAKYDYLGAFNRKWAHPFRFWCYEIILRVMDWEPYIRYGAGLEEEVRFFGGKEITIK